MNIIKEFFTQIGEMIDNTLDKLTTNKVIKKLIIAVAILFLFIIFIALLSSCTRKKAYTYTEFEKQMVTMAKKKYEKSDKLPTEDKGVLEVPLQTFVDSGYIKDVQSVIQNKSACTGNVKIINNYGNYLYVPYLDCGKDYKTKTLYDLIVNDENIVTSGNGLYAFDNGYIFKGDKVNNYVKLNGIKYVILRVNSDGTFRVLDTTRRDMVKWDDRYNVDKNANYGINNYVYNNINSRIKDYVEGLYNNTEIIKNSMKPYYVSTDVCIGKRSENDNIFDTSIECKEMADKHPFTLITANEFYLATLDSNCTNEKLETCSNYNYLSDIGSTWTITADKDTSYKVWKMNNGVYLSNGSLNSYVKIVTTFNKDLVIESGDGSSEKPYIIRTFDTKKK